MSKYAVLQLWYVWSYGYS